MRASTRSLFHANIFLAAFILLFGPLLSFADSTTTKERTITKLAEGVYEIRHPDAPDGFPQGNTTVVIGEKGVLVVDSCLLPSSTKQDIEQIRKWTSKPVVYLVNTHWHFDHTLGNATYQSAFPGLQIIAHRHTAKMLAEWNPGAMERYPGRVGRFKTLLESGKKPDGTPMTDGDRRDFQKAIDGNGAVSAEMKNATQAMANITFDHELSLDLGNRPVEVKFLGRANTAGDTVIYLPKEKIIAVGDILDHPVPYMFGGFPMDFVSTLQALAEFDVQTIVPGHGDVQRDKTYIVQVIDLMKAVNQEVEKELNTGKTPEEVTAALPKTFDVQSWRQKFVGADQDDIDFFNSSFEGLVKASVNQVRMR
jgi:glyoxylase-like metal-dependent hydrolase (beta-lactamase superfamily II)